MTESLFDTQVPSDQTIYQYFEQPLTERMRTFLRLDFLYQQVQYFISRPSKMDSRIAIKTIIDLLNVLSHGDIRNTTLKEIDKFASQLRGYLSYPNIDKHTLQQQLVELGEVRAELDATGFNLGSDLRENEFLNSIKHRSAIPGGACNFDIPAFAHWLRLSYEHRVSDLEGWYKSIAPVHHAIAKLLWLTRESSQHEECVAKHGLYQKQLSRGSNISLIRVGLPESAPLYPEISGSQHRFSIRFHHIKTVNERASQTEADVPFRLICC